MYVRWLCISNFDCLPMSVRIHTLSLLPLTFNAYKQKRIRVYMYLYLLTRQPEAKSTYVCLVYNIAWLTGSRQKVP